MLKVKSQRSKVKRKICFVITSDIHYARNKLVLEELRSREDVELQIVVGAGALLEYYGNVLALLKRDGFPCHAKIIMTLQGGSTVAMAKTTGIGITEFATVFDNLKPDFVVVRGDRYEVLSAAVAAAYLNIPVAHIEGGDVSGTIDESVRHAITKLSHIHFPTNEDSRKRIVRMGEDPRYIYNFGSPELEFIAKLKHKPSNKLMNILGVGDRIDINKPFLVVVQHPVTSEIEKNRDNIKETLHAIYSLEIPTLWFWPNVDAGTDDISKEIRAFRENHSLKHIRFFKHVPPEDFTGLLKNAACLVGNSSAGIKECSYLGTPVVNIGTRQRGRMHAGNVIHVDHDKEGIKQAIKSQLNNGRYKPSNIYYQLGTSKKIAQILATVKPSTQKQFCE